MVRQPDLQLLPAGDFSWQAYDTAVKADLFSTGLHTSSGAYLIDPIELDDAGLDVALRGSSVAGVVMTNANHVRAAANMACRLRVRLYVHPHAASELSDAAVTHVAAGG